MRKESEYIYYKTGYKYQLTRDAWFWTDIRGFDIETKFIHLYEDGWVWIRAGYAWDGASGPTKDTKTSMRGSLLHDSLYQLIRLEALPDIVREASDIELKKRCLQDGMWEVRVNVWERVLKKVGKYFADPKKKKIELRAP